MTDTIAAIATPPGEGGIAIVRISGDAALSILERAFAPASRIAPRKAVYGNVIDGAGGVIDEAIAIYMPAPHSYTREDVCEIQCHGGRAAAKSVLCRALELGARNAVPGEFTKRAFMSGRIDLAQAEAVMSVIKAENDAALRSGVRQLRGGVSGRAQEIAASITDVLADIEAACDYPEEIDSPASVESIMRGILNAIKEIDRSLDPRAARMIVSGVNVAIVGRPNTGKSSLLNALTGFDRAIVSPVAGTTRDAVTADIRLDGIIIHLVDTAGQRQTQDAIENIGVAVAKRAQSEADVVVAVIDGSVRLEAEDEEILKSADERFIVALNKRDIYKDSPRADEKVIREKTCGARLVRTSAAEKDGVKELLEAVKDKCEGADPDSDVLTVERHMDLAREARAHLETARETLEEGFPPDLCAVDVQMAAQKILGIRGMDATESAIETIFNRFCVGK